MEKLKNIITDKLDLSLPYFSMYEKFLTQWDEDNELEMALKEISVAELEEFFLEIFEHYYLPDTEIKEKETIYKDFYGYNTHNLVHATNTKGDHLIFNSTTGVMMSNTSMERLLKEYTIDDITRVRLYCMFHKHSRPDDDFINNLQRLNVKWKPIQLKNPRRVFSRFPEISV